MNIQRILGRNFGIFDADIKKFNDQLIAKIINGKFLVIGGAGTIGHAVTLEIFKRKPKKLHIVDINENNLAELVRDIRSSLGYIKGDFRTFAIDFGSSEFSAITREHGPYDYVLNLSALKHVRSEKDPFTLLRMIDVNIFNTINSLKLFNPKNLTKYFSVSTDKATNPVNMMGASKRIMELFLLEAGNQFNISSARFANVAFSDGSLLHGFTQRFLKRQPISVPTDVLRYFITPEESGQLCLISTILGNNKDIYFPKLTDNLKLTSFVTILERYLSSVGYEIYECSSEDEARSKASALIKEKKWPCYLFKSDTTGEKEFEEFYKSSDIVNYEKYKNIGVVENNSIFNSDQLKMFTSKIKKIRTKKIISKNEIVAVFKEILQDFNHIEKGKSLDEKM